MNDLPWGTIVIFSIFVTLAIIAFAESLVRQRDMQKAIKDIHNSVDEVRNAVSTVSRKAGERIANIEGKMSNCPSCPTEDRRAVGRRRSDYDWSVDSNFTNGV